MSEPRVYLAGPEVFLPDPDVIARAKRELCARYGMEGVFPPDGPVPAELEAGRAERGYAIHVANERLIRSCEILIANLSPFRGPSADVGTVYELGFARGLGLPVFGYTNVGEGFHARTLTHLGATARRRPDGTFEDAEGLRLESFELVDNLMIAGAVHASGGTIVTVPTGPESRWTDLRGFEECLRQAAARRPRAAHSRAITFAEKSSMTRYCRFRGG